MKTKIMLTLTVVAGLYASAAAAQEPEADTAAPQADEGGPTTSECVPECREGFICVEQKCVSKCNPPCAAGLTCTSLGQCVAAASAEASQPAVTTGGAPMMVSAQPGTDASMGPGDPGWAYEAFVLGLVSAAAITGLTAGSAYMHGEPESAYLGLSALGLFAVMNPVLAFGGISARENAITRGYPTARTLSWVGYGLTLAGGIGLGIAGIENDVKPGLIAGVGILGVLSTVGFTVDAYASAAQAESPVGDLGHLRLQQPSFSPTFAVAPEPDGGLAATLGVGGRF